MRLTNTGLKEFPETKEKLIKYATWLFNSAQKDEGHLGDKIALIATTISALEMERKKLHVIFEKQKSDNN